MRTLFTARRLYTPLQEIEHPLLFVEDGLITEISSLSAKELPANITRIDFADAVIAPGYVDIHIHGGAGLDVMLASQAELPRLGMFLATHGVTGYFPTTVAASIDQTCSALERLADAIEAGSAATGGNPVQARPLGIHLEGPFLSHKRRGVHPPENLVLPSVDVFERFWQAARGHVRMMTIAPEPGILGEGLTNSQIGADIIADGIHVSPAIVKLFLQAKGVDAAVLITDAIAAAGMPDGRYRLGPIEVDVKDGKCTVDGKLAGSTLTMDRAVRNVTQFSNWSLRDAVQAATLNPARAVGLAQQHGILAAGVEASFVVLNPAGEVLRTVARGI